MSKTKEANAAFFIEKALGKIRKAKNCFAMDEAYYNTTAPFLHDN